MLPLVLTQGKLVQTIPIMLKVNVRQIIFFCEVDLTVSLKLFSLMTTLTARVGPNIPLGNTTDIKVTALNTGNIGGGNTFNMQGE